VFVGAQSLNGDVTVAHFLAAIPSMSARTRAAAMAAVTTARKDAVMWEGSA